MSSVAGRSSAGSLPGRQIFMDNSLVNPEYDGAIVASSVADSGSTPTHRIRPGNVLGKDSSGEFVEANSANVVASTAPSITSSSHSDGNGVIKLVGNHGTISVTTTTGSGTEANNSDDLNADSAFAAHYIASSAANELTIAARREGADEWFYIHTDTMATAGFAEGVANEVKGTSAEFVVLAQYVDTKDEEGTAQDAQAKVARSGHFDESQLINLTAEAKAYFLSRGALFG